MESLTADEAKHHVFEHWDELQGLAEQRFPRSPALAGEAMNHVLDALQADSWSRVRRWTGKGSIGAFLRAIVVRAMTDFARAKFGHTRPPAEIANLAHEDAIWLDAYGLLVTRSFTRVEATESLCSEYPGRERREIEAVVARVLACNSTRPRFDEGLVPLDDLIGSALAGSGPSSGDAESELNRCFSQVSGALIYWLATADGDPPPGLDELRMRVRPNLELSAEERVFLRLRFAENYSVADAARLVRLDGNPYKRLARLLARIRKACVDAGFTDDPAHNRSGAARETG